MFAYLKQFTQTHTEYERFIHYDSNPIHISLKMSIKLTVDVVERIIYFYRTAVIVF